MASTVPAKSQPLHNFSLPHLIWKNHRSGRNRVAGETSSSSSSPPHRPPSTPSRESPPPVSHAHIPPPPPPPPRQSSPAYVSRRPSPSPLRESVPVVPIGKPSRRTISVKSTKSIDGSKGKRSNKICIRLPKNGNIKQNDAVIDENHSLTPVETTVAPSSAAEEEESLPKTWNLRPRRSPMNHKQLNGSFPKIGSSPLPDNRTSNGSNNNNNNHKKEASELKVNDHSNLMNSKKQKFSIALSREEIEEDIFSFTGLKPSRRPKKRPRSVQKQLDTLFPGLWLGSITADSYKVTEPSLKG